MAGAKVPWGEELKRARAIAVARAKEAKVEEADTDAFDLSIEECYVRLVVAMFASGCGLGMGVMPDGMALWIRLRMPAESTDPRAGHVAFVAHNDPQTVWQKAVQALESSAQSNWWKPDRYAKPPS
jgi:hypothetical protein